MYQGRPLILALEYYLAYESIVTLQNFICMKLYLQIKF
jgi:hypothetical protein